MQVQVNGDQMELPSGATIATLIEKMALAGKRLAVEVNEDIVPRSRPCRSRSRHWRRLNSLPSPPMTAVPILP